MRPLHVVRGLANLHKPIKPPNREGMVVRTYSIGRPAIKVDAAVCDITTVSYHTQIQAGLRKSTLRGRSGVSLIYLAISMAVMCGFASLAVDFGHAQVVKMEMERAAQAAARFGVTGVTDGSAVAKAMAVAGQNQIDGQPIQLQTSDVQTGIWLAATGTFVPTTISPSAIQVTVHRSTAQGNSLTTPFAMALGRQSVDLASTSVATISFGVNTTILLLGGADPWLAGEPSGTTANYTNQGWVDSAPYNSPAMASGLTIKPGNSLNFNFKGEVSNQPTQNLYGPDGNTGWIIDDYASNGVSEHGIADIKAPITSIIGVFLDDNIPDGTAAPTPLDFTTSASRDFSTISPQLKQPFYVGDGFRADGITPQNFVVPPGATRLFLGIMDGQQWSDNSGSGSMAINTPPTIMTVK